MKIDILNHQNLEQIPSGSGIAKVGDDYYVIGDDSPYLYLLNKEFEGLDKKLISTVKDFNGERIVKAEKADFETLEMINETELIIFGSGSKSPQRDILIRILLHDPLHIETYTISPFYDHLKNLPVFRDSELNIEATAFHDNQLFLFNRKKNLVLKFDYRDFLSFIKEEIDFPQPEIKEFSLPKINGIEAGFSGATTLKNQSKIIFTASVEDNLIAYDDGEILGSFIGTIDISNNTISGTFDCCAIPNTDEKFKVESVTVEEETSSAITKVVLISDDDQGHSSIIKGVLSW